MFNTRTFMMVKLSAKGTCRYHFSLKGIYRERLSQIGRLQHLLNKKEAQLAMNRTFGGQKHRKS